MQALILHPTELAQWYALVHEAEAHTQQVLDEKIESYLVYLLMRFMHKTQWLDSVLALDLHAAMQQTRTQKMGLLRDLGDKSLLFSGFFPQLAVRRHVNIQYYTHMGQTAYWYLGDIEHTETGLLYHTLGQQFISLRNLLRHIAIPHRDTGVPQ